MPLPMARPWKHPDSAIDYVRKAVPAALQPLVGRAIEKLSLRTKDPAVARTRFVEAVREIEVRWVTVSAGPTVRTFDVRQDQAESRGFAL